MQRLNAAPQGSPGFYNSAHSTGGADYAEGLVPSTKISPRIAAALR